MPPDFETLLNGCTRSIVPDLRSYGRCSPVRKYPTWEYPPQSNPFEIAELSMCWAIHSD